MGITGLIAVVAILLFGIIFLIPILTNIQDIQENGLICGVLGLCITDTDTKDTERFKDEVEKQQKEAENRRPSTEGEVICDLSVDVHADIIKKDFTIKIYMDESDPADYAWRNCNNTEPLAWIDSFSWVGFEPLAFFLESEFVHTEIALISMDDKTKRYDANDDKYEKTMFRDTRLTQTSGFVPTPLRFDQSFYVEDVVHGNYVLEIYQGRQINSLPVGEPMLDKVCKVNVICK